MKPNKEKIRNELIKHNLYCFRLDKYLSNKTKIELIQKLETTLKINLDIIQLYKFNEIQKQTELLNYSNKIFLINYWIEKKDNETKN